jgi:hypothetical protein
MLVVLALGIVLCAAGVALLFNLFGAGDYTIRRVTSRSLGELAPGFAASRSGFRTYAVLVLAVGALAIGIALENAILLLISAVVFIAASAVAIAGEVTTYRNLKR